MKSSAVSGPPFSKFPESRATFSIDNLLGSSGVSRLPVSRSQTVFPNPPRLPISQNVVDSANSASAVIIGCDSSQPAVIGPNLNSPVELNNRNFNSSTSSYLPSGLGAYMPSPIPLPPPTFGHPFCTSFDIVHGWDPRLPWLYPYLQKTQHKRKGGQIRFTNEQTHALERKFENQKYLSPQERKKLAKSLQLTERQNRRAKWRRIRKDNEEEAPSSVSQGGECSVTPQTVC